MHPDDWFRCADWSVPAQELFERKLQRSRTPFNRAQYMRIKGLSLIEADDPTSRAAGYELLNRLIREYPGERWSIVGAHEILGQAYQADGRFELAEEHLRQAIAECTFQSRTPGHSELRLAQVILQSNHAAKYEEALRLLDDCDDPFLHSLRFEHLVAEARLAARLGNVYKAAACAGAAIGMNKVATPQFSRHPNVGLFTAQQDTLREMEQLAGRAGPVTDTEVDDVPKGEDLSLLPEWLQSLQ